MKIEKQLTVKFQYRLRTSKDLFNPKNLTIAEVLHSVETERQQKCIVFIDEGVADAQPTLTAKISKYFAHYNTSLKLVTNPIVIAGGAAAKQGWKHTLKVIDALATQQIDRQSFVLAIGGGSMLDMIGFAAGMVHRGVRIVRIPSTTLAQNDAGIGLKNGIDILGQKNFLGVFSPPFAVINDYLLLDSLSSEHWLAGVAEAFKVAMIKNRDFYDLLCGVSKTLPKRDETAKKAMYKIIELCANEHIEHIFQNGDPFEQGTARPLDFGHWAAHRLEILSNYRLCHGFAVSIGIALDTTYAYFIKLISLQELQTTLKALQNCHLPIWDDLLNKHDKIIEGLNHFQEHLGGKLHITLPAPIGSRVEINNMDLATIIKSIEYLKEIANH